jgi:hypothetical protein
VQPTDWAYQALSNLIERYGCVAGYPNGTYKGKQAMTRYEAAALLNACLDRITEVTDELKRLMKEFEKELAVLKGRVDGLEAKVGELEATQFSTTTKLKGIATFVLGANSFGGNNTSGLAGVAPAFANGLVNGIRTAEGATSFNYDVRLNFDTSFTGKDLLRTTLRAGNFANSAFGGGNVGLNQLEVAFQEECGAGANGAAVDCGDVVAINRLFYQFPIGNGFTATVGGRVRQDDMLAMWPSVYPADTILDTFTYAGASGTYNLNLGAGAGIWYQKNGWSVSANYVSANGDNGTNSRTLVTSFDPATGAITTANTGGGIGTSGSAQTGTVQFGYAGSNWGAAATYNYTSSGANFLGTSSGAIPSGTNAAQLASILSESMNSVGLSAYWQPSTAGWVPSISVGWGLNGYSSANTAFDYDGVQSQSWYVGLQWADAFIKGNALGMAVGQPTFITSFGSNADIKNAFGNTPMDGNYAWEWWYKFQVTDNISVTPAIFYLSNPLGQTGSNYQSFNGLNNSNAALTNFGGVIKTTFKF